MRGNINLIAFVICATAYAVSQDPTMQKIVLVLGIMNALIFLYLNRKEGE